MQGCSRASRTEVVLDGSDLVIFTIRSLDCSSTQHRPLPTEVTGERNMALKERISLFQRAEVGVQGVGGAPHRQGLESGRFG